MSQPGWANAGPVAPQKQRFSIYSMMLVVSFLALTGSWLMLKTEIESYGETPPWDTSKAMKGSPAPAAPVAPVGDAGAPAGAPPGAPGDGGAPPGMVPPGGAPMPPGGAPMPPGGVPMPPGAM